MTPTNGGVGPWAIAGDPHRLLSAAIALRHAEVEQIFNSRFPGEYVLFGVARLLDAVARQLQDHPDTNHELVSAASEVAEHILKYVPASGDQR